MDSAVSDYEKVLSLHDALLTQEVNLLLDGIRNKCSELYAVRRKLCEGTSIGDLKTVLASNPNKRLGRTYRLQFFRHSQADRGKGVFSERWRKGKNGLPDQRFIVRFTKNVEREVVIQVLKDLVLLDQRLQKVQDALWSLREERGTVLDAFSSSPTQRAIENGSMAAPHGSV